MWERRNKDDFRILSLGDWKSNGIISRSRYSKREVFWRGQAKPCPNETDLFSLVKSTRQKQASLLEAGKAIVDITLDRNLSMALK